jgi:hypothetical protein
MPAPDSLEGVKERVVRGVAVRMSAHAVMGPEMLDELAEAGGRVEEAMPRGVKIAEDVREKIVAEPASLGHADVAAKYGIPVTTVHGIRWRAGVVCKRGRRSAKAGLSSGPVQRVEIDPQRPGTAAALMRATDKVDAGQMRVKVELELSQAEIDRVLDRLGPGQRIAFLSAGLRAALLA